MLSINKKNIHTSKDGPLMLWNLAKVIIQSTHSRVQEEGELARDCAKETDKEGGWGLGKWIRMS